MGRFPRFCRRGWQPGAPRGRRRAAATTDAAAAEIVAAQRLLALKERRAQRQLMGVQKSATLAEFAAEHLQKAELDDVTDRSLEANERYLAQAVTFFGAGRELTDIRPSHVKDWMQWVRRNVRGKGGGAASDGTIP